MTQLSFDRFFNAFITAALWSSIDNEGEFLDSNYCADDIDSDSLDELAKKARHWWYRQNGFLLILERQNGIYAGEHGYELDELAGHDLWLTMNGHGAGFWDRDIYTYELDSGVWVEYRDQFTKAARAVGECGLYVGDDGKIYV